MKASRKNEEAPVAGVEDGRVEFDRSTLLRLVNEATLVELAQDHIAKILQSFLVVLLEDLEVEHVG
jgi:hypothetical protein